MIFAVIRGLILGFIVMSVVFGILRWHLGSLRRESLEKQWDEGEDGVQNTDRDTYVEQGMAAYRKSFLRNAIVLVYLVPLVLYLAILYLNNFS